MTSILLLIVITSIYLSWPIKVSFNSIIKILLLIISFPTLIWHLLKKINPKELKIEISPDVICLNKFATNQNKEITLVPKNIKAIIHVVDGESHIITKDQDRIVLDQMIMMKKRNI